MKEVFTCPAQFSGVEMPTYRVNLPIYPSRQIQKG